MSKINQSIPQKFPPVVTWRVTSKCNNSCPYCYGPNCDIPHLDLATIDKMLALFSKNGVKVVALTGGEPTFRKDFPNIVDLLKKYHFEIFMDTDGDFFEIYKDTIINNFKGIGLTIDFPDESQRYRVPGNFKRVLDILNHFSTSKNRPIIRVATVVTQDNYLLLPKIGSLLCRYTIDIWKIYQFIPQNTNATKNRQALEIPQDKFESAVKDLENKFSSNFKVVVSRMEDRNACYFFVGSNGQVIMPTQNGDVFEEKIIGHIFDQNIIPKWEKAVSFNNFKKNHQVSLKYKFK